MIYFGPRATPVSQATTMTLMSLFVAVVIPSILMRDPLILVSRQMLARPCDSALHVFTSLRNRFKKKERDVWLIEPPSFQCVRIHISFDLLMRLIWRLNIILQLVDVISYFEHTWVSAQWKIISTLSWD